MKNFARINSTAVVEVISIPDDYAIEDCFTPDLVETLVSINGIFPMPEAGWSYDGSSFSEPTPYQRSAEEIVSTNACTRDAFLAVATLAIAPLQDAVDLEVATSEERSLLTLWKQYRVAVNRIDTSNSDPVWPTPPVEPGHVEANPTA
jgi:hypothetical protein